MAMHEYIIGSGAVLTADATTGAAAATLHARTDPLIAQSVRAALFDFEASAAGELSRIVILAAGWNPRRFEAEVVQPLAQRVAAPLAEVLIALGRATHASDLHIFARWLPDEALVAALDRARIEVIAHPLEAIAHAALISGQRYTHWRSPLRAA